MEVVAGAPIPHVRRPICRITDPLSYGLEYRRNMGRAMKAVRVRVYIPGVRKLVLIGSFPNDYQARRARDKALLELVPGAADVFPWLRKRRPE